MRILNEERIVSSTAEKQRNNEDLLAINATLETEIAELKYQVGKQGDCMNVL